MYKDTQNEYANTSLIVGVKEVRTKIMVNKKIFIPIISLKISTGNNRGIHMSRLIESLTEYINSNTEENVLSLEDYSLSVYLDLKKRHPFDYFELNISTELAIPELTPATKNKTIEVHDIFFSLKEQDGKILKNMSVKVIGSSCCPHSLINNEHKRAHVQRSEIILSWETEKDNILPTFEYLIKICNNSFSSPVYTLLKTPDEQHIVNNIFEHPYFVEDIIRNVIKNSSSLKNGTLNIKVTNFESIHRHNAIAEKTLKK